MTLGANKSKTVLQRAQNPDTVEARDPLVRGPCWTCVQNLRTKSNKDLYLTWPRKTSYVHMGPTMGLYPGAVIKIYMYVYFF